MSMSPIEVFRRKMDAGERVLGGSVTFADGLISDALGSAVEFLWIDLEHCAMSPEALSGHLMACRLHKIPSLVRTPSHHTPFVKAALDAGADGVIVPQIVSAAEARQVVSDCRYPPLGRRGYGPRVPSDYGRDGGDEYVLRANRSVFCSVQIENAEALADIGNICRVAGLDSVVIGPYDLSASLGVMGKLRHPLVLDGIARVVQEARGRGLYVGAGMGCDADYAALLAQMGVNWLQIGNDYSYMIAAAQTVLDGARRKIAEVC